ncbi:hypothetical protein [Tsukamurella paurometabola]|nr:hypothetical protein [Tsukamurella paurometabola]
MTEAQARARFDTDGATKLTVALISDESPDGVPFATIETMPHGNGVSVNRYTASGTPILGIGYKEIDGRMFAFGANEFHYPDPRESESTLLSLTAASKVEAYSFTPDGTAEVRRQLNEALYEFISLKVAQTPERSEANWKPLLKFGNWDAYIPPTLAEFHEGLTIEEDVVLNRSDAYPG